MKQDEFGVEIRCTDCSLVKTFQSRDEIPDKYRDGCPRCNSELAVKPIGN